MLTPVEPDYSTVHFVRSLVWPKHNFIACSDRAFRNGTAHTEGGTACFSFRSDRAAREQQKLTGRWSGSTRRRSPSFRPLPVWWEWRTGRLRSLRGKAHVWCGRRSGSPCGTSAVHTDPFLLLQLRNDTCEHDFNAGSVCDYNK